MYAHALSLDREALVRSVNALPSLPAVVMELMALVPHDMGRLAAESHYLDAMTHALDLAGTPTEAVPIQDSGTWQRMNISDAKLQTLSSDTEAEFADLMARLHPTSEAL